MDKLVPKIQQWFPWNGSKRWLIKYLIPVMNKWHGKGRYIDPFVGGGSVAASVKCLFEADQYLSDANPWLMAAFQSQITGGFLSDNYISIDYWRNLTDSDLQHMSVNDKANRFAICLFTAWGNRWETKPDGRFCGTLNKKYCEPDYLRNRLNTFFSIKWLKTNDTISCLDWKEAVEEAVSGDLVYIDPPYPESLGYGNQWWSFSDQLDIVDWAADTIKKNISVVISNMATIERLYKRANFNTSIVLGPKSSKTRKNREEIIAWHISEK